MIVFIRYKTYFSRKTKRLTLWQADILILSRVPQMGVSHLRGSLEIEA
jgi:hypothetical protein